MYGTAATGLPVRAVVLLSAAAFVSAATMRVADPLVPQVALEFTTTTGQAAVIVTAFALAYGLCQLLWGPLGDRYGKYRLITAMTLISALTVATGGLADSLSALSIARLVSGMTAAALIPLAMAFIGDHVAYADRQPVIARFLSGQIMGLVAGQVFGGVFGDTVGWRGVFLLLGLLYLLVGVLLVLELRSPRLPVPVLAPATSARQLAMGFVRLLGRAWAGTVLLTVFVEGMLFFGAFTFVGATLNHVYGFGYTRVGLYLAAFGLGGLAFAVGVRPLVRHLKERGLALVGGALIAVSFAVLALTPPTFLLPLVIFLLGLGFYMLHNTLQTNATQMAPEARGLAVSAFASCFFLGQAVGAWLAGMVVDQAGFTPLFAVVAPAILVLAVLFANALQRRPAPA